MKKIAIIYGGNSNEHEVSIKSAKSVYDNIDKNKYDVSLYYLDRQNQIFKTNNFLLNDLIKTTYMDLKEYDLVFPVMHGSYVEDGKLQGMFEILNIPYVGSNLLTSAICMDKVMTKKILDRAKIPNSPYIYIYNDYDLDKLEKEIEEKISFPCFIKPASGGSSIGISKCLNKNNLDTAIKEALKYDKKVLIEKYIDGKELEVAIIGNNNLIVSDIGEIITNDIFYTYDAKYNSNSITKISSLEDSIKNKIKEYAKLAYKELECKVLSRIDFLLDNQNNIYLNEINTMPGFTNISMFPYLMNQNNISYSELIDKIIELSFEKYR